MNNIKIYNCDNAQLLANTPDNSIDIILIDPPYMYLNHKLDKPFDIYTFYPQCLRVLKKEQAALIFFGRGPSFYKSASLLVDLGFTFKEEIIWHKCRATTPMTPINRTHETIAIFTLGKAKINRVRIPITEKCKYEPQRIANLITALASAIKKPEKLEKVKNYFETGQKILENTNEKDSITIKNREKRIDRNVSTAQIIAEGGKEESVIKENLDNFYNSLHPTQKPVQLLKRLLNLVKPENKKPDEIIVADFFAGSFSTMVAVQELGMKGISCEIDQEYFNIGKTRLQQTINN